MNDNNIRNFYKEVEECLDGEYKIILEPKRNLKEEWIEYDPGKMGNGRWDKRFSRQFIKRKKV